MPEPGGLQRPAPEKPARSLQKTHRGGGPRPRAREARQRCRPPHPHLLRDSGWWLFGAFQSEAQVSARMRTRSDSLDQAAQGAERHPVRSCRARAAIARAPEGQCLRQPLASPEDQIDDEEALSLAGQEDSHPRPHQPRDLHFWLHGKCGA